MIHSRVDRPRVPELVSRILRRADGAGKAAE
jgi:hypothetical protein